MRRHWLVPALLLSLAAVATATGADRADWDEMKLRWQDLTPAERADYEQQQRRWLATQGFSTDPGKTSGDACTQAKFEITDLPFIDQGTTENKLDHTNLSLFGACVAGGTQMTATGSGPDVFYRIQVNETCQLQVSLQPQSRDLALYIVENCFSPALTCRGVSDGGQSGVREELTFVARPTESYYIIVDGFAGDADDFELTVQEVSARGAPLVGCMLVPVELQRFSVE